MEKERDRGAARHRRRLSENPAVLGQARRHAGPRQRGLGELDRHVAAAAGEIRHDVEVGDIGRRHALEPDRLPDAGGAVIPDGVRLELPVLLAARLGQVVGMVLGTDDQDLRSVGGQRGGDVGGEGSLPADMIGDEGAVHPDPGRIVDGAEVQQQAPPVERRGVEVAAIPDDRVEALVADPRQRGFGRKGDCYGARERRLSSVPSGREAFVAIIVRELPRAAQVGPVGTAHLRPGVQGSGHRSSYQAERRRGSGSTVKAMRSQARCSMSSLRGTAEGSSQRFTVSEGSAARS